MARWQINLTVLWFGQFFVMAGMTMIIPFLPLYLQDLGIHDPKELSFWAGIVFAGNFVTSFIFQPIWGSLADRYGRKMMLLRSGFGMAAVMVLMGFAQNAWQLLLLRMLNGTISGFAPAAVALVSASTPREKIGFAMGTVQSGGVAGTIFGPLIGGLLASHFGFRPIFFITGGSIFLASMLALYLVKETFNRAEAKEKPRVSVLSGFKQLASIPQLPALFSVTFLIQFALLSPQPQMALYVQELHGTTAMLAFWAGLVGSINGFSNMISSPLLGRWGDKLGSQRILAVSLIGSAIAFLPQAFVGSVWQLLIVRFFVGMFMGGLLPSVNSLIRKYTPDGMESRAYSFNTSTLALGNLIGPVMGGLLSGWISIRGLFVISSVLLLLNFFWVRKTLYAGGKASAVD
ncbi:multidrug resistance protein [Paenibacillus sp. J31TS4]|uniref:MFS transporter n=1 Tax=Paenibacillus sp. J31TS4 TaxID=2807195 RepID=UPI001B22A0F1|nr:MFS transporter [Paenibacillus sp. J31TS4]GIP38067.1 multidrug resistance protein [Paenibacillus sp. J31TS4]